MTITTIHWIEDSEDRFAMVSDKILTADPRYSYAGGQRTGWSLVWKANRWELEGAPEGEFIFANYWLSSAQAEAERMYRRAIVRALEVTA